MRNWLKSLLVGGAAALIVSCGGGGGGTCLAASCNSTTPTPLPSYNILLTFDNAQINPATGEVALTAVVTTAGTNVAAEGVVVAFSADSGSVTGSVTTNAAGVATAVFTSTTNKSARDVTITATVGSSSQSVVVAVLGPQLGFGGTLSTVIGQPVTVTIDVKDLDSNPIVNQAVALTSASGSFSPAAPVTNSSGVATTTFTPTTSGNVSISATVLNVTQTSAIEVSGTNFTFTAPEGNSAIDVNTCSSYLGVPTPITVQLLGGVGPVTFATTQGTLYSDSGCTTVISSSTQVVLDGSGSATVYIRSGLTGTATLTATAANAGSPASTTIPLRFVSRIPAQITLTSAPSVISAGGTSTITAYVKDSSNNPVSDAQVIFNGSGNGSLNVGVATTNSNGQASTVFTAAGALTGLNDLQIEGTIVGVASATTTLTVAGQGINVTIGYDNTIADIADQAIYRKILNVTVSDSAQGPVKDAVVSIASIAKRYRKGAMQISGSQWMQFATATCLAEDLNGNGILDTLTETDENSNGILDPQTGAVVRKPDGVTGNLETNAGGRVTVWLEYPQNEAMWVELEIRATANVQGVNSTGVATMWIPLLAADANNVNASPPNEISPYGIAAVCANPL